MARTHVVTGASGYTGRYVARLLLERGDNVRSLTAHPGRPTPFSDRVSEFPFDFDRPDALRRSLEGADTLFNTYWIRFSRGELTHEMAVENLRALFAVAKRAGVRRVVHVSITNADQSSPLSYFRGKAEVEEILRSSGISHAILKPTLIFGKEDVLLNNIAWSLRRFPFILIPGDGLYEVQPICVDDLAKLAVEMADGEDDVEIDAVGPDVFTYAGLVELIRTKLGVSCRLMRVTPSLAMLAARALGALLGDVVLTQDELAGLSAGLLVSRSEARPLGATGLSDWLDGNAGTLGQAYTSELRRHYR